MIPVDQDTDGNRLIPVGEIVADGYYINSCPPSHKPTRIILMPVGQVKSRRGLTYSRRPLLLADGD